MVELECDRGWRIDGTGGAVHLVSGGDRWIGRDERIDGEQGVIEVLGPSRARAGMVEESRDERVAARKDPRTNEDEEWEQPIERNDEQGGR